MYEARAGDAQTEPPAPDERLGKGAPHEPVRTRLMRWLREQEQEEQVAAPDQAVRVTYVAETGLMPSSSARVCGWNSGSGG